MYKRQAFGFEGEVASFADVSANAYYAEPVGIAKTLGIVGGVNESDFAPSAEIKMCIRDRLQISLQRQRRAEKLNLPVLVWEQPPQQ